MANVWITALAKDTTSVQAVTAHLKQYGLGVGGHFWIDDLEKFAWFDVLEEMGKHNASAWVILSNDAEIAKPSVRYGLNALAIAATGRSGRELPIAWIGATGAAADARPALPTALAGALIIDEKTPSWQAKVVAMAHRTRKAPSAPYRISLHAHSRFGQWYEVGPMSGPASETWSGAMFGVAGADIDFHGVGPKGDLPEKAVLEYPQKDIKLALGEREYTAWAVQNTIGPDQSYFVRVKGAPTSLLFGPVAQGDDAEVFVLQCS
jgi:hypothetical protein